MRDLRGWIIAIFVVVTIGVLAFMGVIGNKNNGSTNGGTSGSSSVRSVEKVDQNAIKEQAPAEEKEAKTDAAAVEAPAEENEIK